MLSQYAVIPCRMVQVDIFYIINWSLGSNFHTSYFRCSKYFQLKLLLLRSTNFYLNRVYTNEPLYLVY